MFRITLRQLEIFRAVAGEGSTAAAAHKLPLSQSATSAGLNQLERSLGFRLFDRIGKRLAINAEGKALLSKALGVLDNAHQLESGTAARVRSTCAFTPAPPSAITSCRGFSRAFGGNAREAGWRPASAILSR